MSLIFIDGRIFRRIVPIVLVAAIFVGGLAIYGSAHFEGASESDFSESASNAQTFQWRENSWVQLFYDPDQTLSTVMIGKSIGSGYWRIDPETDLPITVAPHNEFVQDYLRVGAIGVLLSFCFPQSKSDPLLLWRTNKAVESVRCLPLKFGLGTGLVRCSRFLHHIFSRPSSIRSHRYRQCCCVAHQTGRRLRTLH